MGRRSKRSAHDDGPKSAVAARLRALRKGLGYTQDQMAELVGVSGKAWQNYEMALRWLHPMHATKLCEKTLVTTDWLYRGSVALLPVEVRAMIEAGERRDQADRRKR